MMADTVLISKADGVATVRLNRPDRLNAINPTLLADFTAALADANGDDDVRAIVLAGVGRAFCAGDDLKEFDDQAGTEAETRAYVEQIQDVTRALCLNDKMVVGAIHGWAVGGGLEWVVNCDFVVMARSCRFFFPEVSLGIFVTGGVTQILPRQIGLQRTREMILLGEKYSAEDAAGLGFDWRIVDDGDVMATARDLARRIADLPQGPVRNLKRALRVAPGLDLEGAMAIETDATVEGFLDPAAAELARARLAKG